MLSDRYYFDEIGMQIDLESERVRRSNFAGGSFGVWATELGGRNFGSNPRAPPSPGGPRLSTEEFNGLI